MFHHKRNWMRHNAMVPKGFIRYHVLEALNEKPMSGSELMEQIEKHTGGTWKPSPGSIYPLLSWLQDNGYIKELPTENGLKRYELTQSGKALLEEQTKMRHKVREEGGFFAEPFFDRFFMKMPPEKSQQIGLSMKRFATSTVKLGNTLREKYSEQAVDEALKAINNASAKLEEINSKLKGESK
ncbi:MAG: PadR family transcriptional regulator [Candidatus Bathyarchaeota archaeon]|nr:PadR family transcriptional regulator [Candidatus Bathyarchaeota archaeon]